MKGLGRLVFVAAQAAFGLVDHLVDDRSLMVVLMTVRDKLVDVQFGERRHRIGGMHDLLQRVVGRHGPGHHRKEVADLFGPWHRGSPASSSA